MIACPKPKLLVNDFDVKKNENVPTHAFVQISVSRNAMQGEMAFLRTLPNLKKPSDERVHKLAEQKRRRRASTKARPTTKSEKQSSGRFTGRWIRTSRRYKQR